MSYLYRFGIPIVGFGLLLFGWVKYQEASGIFFPSQYHKSRLNRLPESVEFVRFESTDGVELTGLYKSGQPDSPVVVFTHGNAGHMLNRLPWLSTILPEDWTGLILDYRGYGLSGGSPSVSGVKKDARSAVQYALQRSESDRLFLYGRSLGVPMAAYASQFNRAEGIVLESGFPNTRSVASEILPVPGIGYLLSVEMNTVDYIEKAEEKHGELRKLVIHGTEDKVLPVSLGRQLFERLPGPKQKFIVDGAGHNDLRRVAGKRYDQTIRRFLTQNDASGSPVAR
ncbi:MAG: alpha/beta hydrolase [bacterium]